MDDPNLGTIASRYQRFAEIEAPGQSAIFEKWASGVADDPEVLQLLTELPTPKQQPNLFFACSRLLGCPVATYPEFREWVIANWDAVSAQMLVRATQTNEPRRSALLIPPLGLIDGPIALLEVGASAGLCLYPDRYSYLYDGRRLDPVGGPSSVLLECETTGNPPIPERMPQIAWRAGIDLNPLDLTNDDDVNWLETLIWPEQDARRERIHAAIEIVRADPPRIVRGDGIDDLPALVAEAPPELTLVIVDSASIVYMMPEPRARFIEYVTGLDARWISNEGRGIVPSAAEGLGQTGARELSEFVLAMDGRAIAFTGGHGQRLDWL
ncbi:MAG TPA: DUF2332 domain-containing protein [Galbitalea sp.]|nr:DUF2332 domain-containing protein [Galbitalea sp.]